MNLAVYFAGPAIRLQHGIIDCLAGHLLDCAFHILRRSGDPVRHDDVFLQDRAKAPERATLGGGVVSVFLWSHSQPSGPPSNDLFKIAHRGKRFIIEGKFAF